MKVEDDVGGSLYFREKPRIGQRHSEAFDAERRKKGQVIWPLELISNFLRAMHKKNDCSNALYKRNRLLSRDAFSYFKAKK